jgi:hypothetical protein
VRIDGSYEWARTPLRFRLHPPIGEAAKVFGELLGRSRDGAIAGRTPPTLSWCLKGVHPKQPVGPWWLGYVRSGPDLEPYFTLAGGDTPLRTSLRFTECRWWAHCSLLLKIFRVLSGWIKCKHLILVAHNNLRKYHLYGLVYFPLTWSMVKRMKKKL